jgi:hypothetical protein
MGSAPLHPRQAEAWTIHASGASRSMHEGTKSLVKEIPLQIGDSALVGSMSLFRQGKTLSPTCSRNLWTSCAFVYVGQFVSERSEWVLEYANTLV